MSSITPPIPRPGAPGHAGGLCSARSWSARTEVKIVREPPQPMRTDDIPARFSIRVELKRTALRRRRIRIDRDGAAHERVNPTEVPVHARIGERKAEALANLQIARIPESSVGCGRVDARARVSPGDWSTWRHSHAKHARAEVRGLT